jgi:hypothetical protein
MRCGGWMPSTTGRGGRGSANVGGEHEPGHLDVHKRGEADVPEFAAFVWPVSDIVMALVRTGLRLDAYFEGPEPAIYAGLGDAAAHIPAYYVVKATKTAPATARLQDLNPPLETLWPPPRS